MDNQMILKDITAMTPQYQEAMEIHNKIMANGVMAALALVELCRNLKLMRDRRAYEHLGFATFDDYAEQMANMKRRQAYNYIATYERLGADFLQSNAQLGITKLELLSQLPESTREELVADPEIEAKSTRELKDLVVELNKAKEQISWLENEKAAAEEGSADVEQELKALRLKVGQLETAAAAREKQQKQDDAAARKAIEEKIRQQLETETQKKLNAIKEEVAQAKIDGIEIGRQVVRESLDAVTKEKAEAVARAQDLEKRLQMAANPESVIITHLFDQLNGTVGKLYETISRVEATDPEAAAKFRGAVRKYLKLADQKFSGE